MELEELIREFHRKNKHKKDSRARIEKAKTGELKLIPCRHMKKEYPFALYDLELTRDTIDLRANFTCQYSKNLFLGETIGIERVSEILGTEFFTREALPSLKAAYDLESAYISLIRKHRWMDKETLVNAAADFDTVTQTMEELCDMPLEEFQAIIGDSVFVFDSGITEGMEIHRQGLVEHTGEMFMTCEDALEIIDDSAGYMDPSAAFRAVNAFLVDNLYFEEMPEADYSYYLLDDPLTTLPGYLRNSNSLYLFSQIEEIGVCLEKDFRESFMFRPRFNLHISRLSGLADILSEIDAENMPDDSPSELFISPLSNDIEKDLQNSYFCMGLPASQGKGNIAVLAAPARTRRIEQLYKTENGDTLLSFEAELGERGAIVRPEIDPDIADRIYADMQDIRYKRILKFGKSARKNLGDKEYKKILAILGAEDLPVTFFRAHARDRKASILFREGKFRFFNWYSNPYEDIGKDRYCSDPISMTTSEMFSVLGKYRKKGLYLRELHLEGVLEDDRRKQRVFMPVLGGSLGKFDNLLFLEGKYQGIDATLFYDLQNSSEKELNLYVPKENLGMGVLTAAAQKIAETVSSSDIDFY